MLIAGLPTGTSRSIVKALADLALDLRLLMVAEGIETREGLQAVRNLDFSCGQGFLLNLPPCRASALLAADPTRVLANGR